MTGTPWLAALAALFLWWFSTGVILWRVRRADNGGPQAHAWSVLLGLPLLIAGGLGFHHSLSDASVTGVHIAFLSALAIWGWIELAFLSGVITGPNRRPCPAAAAEWERFLRAFGTIAWHEILLAAVTVLMGLMAWDQANHFGFLTFAVLFFARISAKLNLFFGVANINTEFLPQPLAHLPSHFRRRPMNGFFPVSVTALCFAAGCWLERLITSPTPGAEAGFALLTALTLLALLEHWFMVLPLPDQKLWRWMIDPPTPKTTAPAHAALKETPHGF
jgi:putative photosynthetic complex assembly protein 2